MNILIKRIITYDCSISAGLIDLAPLSGLIHSIRIPEIEFETNSKWNIIRKNAGRLIIFNTITDKTDYTFYARNIDSNFVKRYYTPIQTRMNTLQVKESIYWDKIKETDSLFIEIPKLKTEQETFKIECVQFIPYRRDIHFYEIYQEITFEQFIK
jgi:hypothetical protein